MTAFGDLLRAARLGYRWCPAWECFIRVAVLDEERFYVTAARRGCIPGSHGGPKRHVVWWESHGCVEALAGMKSAILAVFNGSVSFTVNNDGHEVEVLR